MIRFVFPLAESYLVCLDLIADTVQYFTYYKAATIFEYVYLFMAASISSRVIGAVLIGKSSTAGSGMFIVLTGSAFRRSLKYACHSDNRSLVFWICVPSLFLTLVLLDLFFPAMLLITAHVRFT